MSSLSDELEALRPPVEPPAQGKWRKRRAVTEPGAEPRVGDHLTSHRPTPPLGEGLIAGMVVSMVLFSAALALGFEPGGAGPQSVEFASTPAGGAAGPSATSTSSPPTTQPEPAVAVLAADPVVPATTPTTAPAPVAAPTTTTTRAAVAPTTTTTARPAPIAPVSATSAHPAVTLTLDLTPGAGIRSLEGRLSALLADDQALRAVRTDFGDGTVAPGTVHPWPCYAPGAPNPSAVALPDHTYAKAGTYPVTVVVTTAGCTWPEETWGPETFSEIRVNVVVR